MYVVSTSGYHIIQKRQARLAAAAAGSSASDPDETKTN
jgi:hypothetical protein